jgi:hypothetical protein
MSRIDAEVAFSRFDEVLSGELKFDWGNLPQDSIVNKQKSINSEQFHMLHFNMHGLQLRQFKVIVHGLGITLIHTYQGWVSHSYCASLALTPPHVYNPYS